MRPIDILKSDNILHAEPIFFFICLSLLRVACWLTWSKNYKIDLVQLIIFPNLDYLSPWDSIKEWRDTSNLLESPKAVRERERFCQSSGTQTGWGGRKSIKIKKIKRTISIVVILDTAFSWILGPLDYSISWWTDAFLKYKLGTAWLLGSQFNSINLWD